ncbi:Histone-lysine N-methyltransferase SETMAR [Eumeta japonica]|uniref:Histone-lysine N-methyltransferase SETMAR n=1 Tax=Eumeta variegata TaxID=151549 RepID=A0A4C1XJ06_EUMVA|nr:Histone-lysine N-methyltransferase SETMAR [Eumeta japonica]
MTCVKLLRMKQLSEFHRGRAILTDEIKEDRLKSVVVPENIDAVRKITMQDCHDTYRNIKTSLGIKVFEKLRKNNRQRRIVLHNDNASRHTSAETTRFMEGQKVELTGHPLYSSDLASNNFYLFPSVKNKLRGHRFPSRGEAVDAFKTHVLDVTQSERKKYYNN